ncbi:hypothetical protein IFU39_00230 [Paenibacillus sp. CFBP 13594]|uniref:hypothetical protein n=1 Tax=Paenibacillus sp. CFBP 13594 TaxID=2774037 RepID=UPI00177C0751|nr:hypothetical protein [Paenibacillus sp. CFBP 13594]MBD8836245.1 hypothetical protein [Paenibacillus sp. CFBP 13594]
MMIFLSILFFALNLYMIFKGPLFSETGKKLKLLEISEVEGKRADSEYKSKVVDGFMKDGCLPLIMALLLTIVEVIYLVVAIGFDPIKIPTLLAILFFIFTWIQASLKKKVKDMTDSEIVIEKAKLQSRKSVTYSSVLKAIMWTTYFGYMTYILVF